MLRERLFLVFLLILACTIFGVLLSNSASTVREIEAKHSVHSRFFTTRGNQDCPKAADLVSTRAYSCIPSKGALYDNAISRMFSTDLSPQIDDRLNAHISPAAASYRPRAVLINGERHHGTNWMGSLVDDNLLIPNAITKDDVWSRRLTFREWINQIYGWKHWEFPLEYVPMLEQHNHVLVVMLRNPYVWLPKMYAVPYNTIGWPPKNLNFQCWLSEPYRERRNVISFEDPSDLRSGKTAAETRKSSSLLESLAQKLHHWIEELRVRTDRVYFIRYEKLKEDPEGELRKFARTYGLSLKGNTFRNVDGYKGHAQPRAVGNSGAPPLHGHNNGNEVDMVLDFWCGHGGMSDIAQVHSMVGSIAASLGYANFSDLGMPPAPARPCPHTPDL